MTHINQTLGISVISNSHLSPSNPSFRWKQFDLPPMYVLMSGKRSTSDVHSWSR
jgi:hypothetical protein